ncbi:MAG: putative membrane-bound dehydrogenase-like protein, partial [Verrucomicrobiales bacterium]
HIIWPKDPEAAFKDADTVVFFCSGGNGHLVNKHVKEFDAVMKSGVGLACLHYGVEVPIGPPGKGMLNWMGGYFEAHWSVNPHWVASFDTFSDHPAANGIKPFKSDDEWYFHMRFRGDMEGITPILSAKAPLETMKRDDGPHSGNPAVRKAVAAGESQHVAWTYQRGEDYGNGRGFGFTGIHYHKNLGNDSFRKTVLNGVAWTAKLDIPEGGVESKTPSAEDLTTSISETAEKFGKKKEEPKKKEDKKQASGGSNKDLRDPANAVSSLDLHPGLEATLFASEPMMMSPSSIEVDHLGRVWVCEVVNYRGHKGKRPEGDRVLILEDTTGDGKADKSTVFYQGNDIDSLHGICVLGDRVILSANDDVFSVYDDNGDGKADRKELMFTKIGGSQHDHGIHAFMFGHDGRLYFNFGNAANQLCDKDGKLIVDLAGNEVNNQRKPYQQGMIFRCALDGSNVETMAWNFRNNWEMAVDSYGAMWQSDNDDDGNRGVRINYVMDYGNYGYRDELNGAGWQDERVGMHEEIPLRHWHLRDPGVVPNLLQTGAGSPTGLTIYEGKLLPKEFHGQILHCDAGPNVCRAYPVQNDGAGYKAETVNILSSTTDRWYRPSDVAVAPDGSLMIADWYDPGVGGHGMGDLERGRVFRVAPLGKTAYQIAKVDTSTTDGALAALKSPNNATRFLGWTALSQSDEGRKAARDLYRDKEADPRHRARGLHLLGWHKKAYVKSALKDNDPNIRMAGLRLARQHNSHLLESIEMLAGDKDPQVRRECALALRFLSGVSADQLWAKLAAQHNGEDRWYLEALGIGADLHWDSRMKAFLALGDHGKGARDIHWRSRASDTASHLAKALLKESSPAGRNRLLRAFHFQPSGDAKDNALLSVFDKGDAEAAVSIAFTLPSDKITQAPERAKKARQLIEALKGKPEMVKLISHLGMEGTETLLLDFIKNQANPNKESILAARTLLGRSNSANDALASSEGAAFERLSRSIGATGDERAVSQLVQMVEQPERDLAIRQKLIEAIAFSSRGEKQLFDMVKKGKLPSDLKFTTAAVLGRSRDRQIRDGIAEALNLPPTPGAEKFPPIPKLVQVKGHANKGAAAFAKAICATCHVVKGQGIDFGPNLSEIGDKLSIEGIYETILYPSNAISHGFHGVILTGNDDTQLGGYIVSETAESVSVRMAGGVTQAMAVSSIKKRENLTQSLMPPGLAATLSTQELADLVAYLRTLTK